ncbi:acetyl-CoA carboxylase biotin carboxylase subunit [Litorivivens sp.]|uniref:acetyl-CoA carboxylase biotin carboxylase subunit n=1 Tax=Litorivivens sp. TaxID=2020868 RepID=UPI0035642A09
MFKKILIANRGEISCRIIKTAKKMGIRTVAVYSDADRNALHVSLADEAIHIGAAPAAESYLVVDKIIEAAKKTGAEAIHPGYGFLSENANFCRRCAEENIVFIGPPTGAIEAMGSKSAAKQIMEKAGVPLVPGYHGEDQDEAILKKSADDMGYPVLLKAAAGGGGKGMRQVWSADEFSAALAAAKREAMKSFSDDKMLVEKYLTGPRHVEIQVFCDSHGNAVHLFERDCSVQRRHQKVIEEAPAPGMTEELRTAMGEAAIKAAQAIDYVGAGTVEFLLDSDGSFYFMEMNTRLQVEHPVTEMISGQDLVSWQLKVANGETLPCKQAELSIRGHAFEARVYAEDPDNNFLPQTGNLRFLKEPAQGDHVRVDTGVVEGDEISVYYDPMISKLITWDENRDRALKRLQSALAQYNLGGVVTNLPFLYNLATHPAFENAELTTGFIEQHNDDLFKDNDADLNQLLPLAALYVLLEQAEQQRAQAEKSSEPDSPWNTPFGWRSALPAYCHVDVRWQEQEHRVSVEPLGDQFQLSFEGETALVSGTLQDRKLSAIVDGHRVTATVSKFGDDYQVYLADRAFSFTLVQPDTGEMDDSAAGASFAAPMNGTIVAHGVEPGVEVKKGATLMIMEAMKMEHTINAPADGKVVTFFFKAGDLVDGGAQLLEFEASE